MTTPSVGQAVPSPQPPQQAAQPPLQPEAATGQGYASAAGTPAPVPTMPSTIETLKAAQVWLLWKSVQRVDKPKPDKIPYYVSGRRRQGVLDGAEDRANLTSYAGAVAAMEAAPGVYAGLAIALGPDGNGGCWQGIDLDAIVGNGLADIADLWTRGSCASLCYVEMSPSGQGLHIIGYGRSFRSLGSNGTGIEAYAGGRFFTFTGVPIVGGAENQLYDLADYVERELASRHTSQPVAVTDMVGRVPVDSKTVSELRDALAFMPSDDRELWVRMGHALKELGQIGLGLWTSWSEKSEKYDPRAAMKAWADFKPRRTGYQSVFAEAARQGWINPASKAAQLSPATIPTVATERKLVGRALGGVQMRSIDWLWTGWIPKGYITLFAGETGAGKSTVLADITSRVTTGAAWPGEYLATPREPSRVLWLGSEDSIEEMTAPRLTACGANLDNVIEIEGVSHEGKRNTFSMQDDLEAVSEWLRFAREEGKPFAMLVIDPVTSYLPGQKLRKVDLNDAGHLRTILEPWLRLAQTHNIAIVCVTHFAKDTTRSMLHRVLGSAAFAQTCRSLCAVIQRPTPRDEEPEPHAKAFVQVKVNLPEHPGGAWKFSTEKVEVGTDPRNGRVITATRPAWEALDGALTPESMMGGTRGPVSQYEATFGMWFSAQFIGHPPGHWLRVDQVKLAAKVDKACTDRWWSEHSGTFMEKQNVQGFWFCRPKQGKGETT
jgi:hypothetical protein